MPHAVCTLFLLARVWSRLLLLRKWFRDDTLILAAWLCSTAVCAAYAIAAQTPNLNSAVLHGGSSGGAYSLTTYLGLIFYQLALLLTKLSILSFYLRMFSSRPVERALALATVGVVVAYGVPLLAISILQCPPPSSSGGGFSSFPRPTTGKCFAFTPLLIASASLHTATDAWLIALVAPCVSRLAIPRGQKAALAAVLSLGVFVVAASLTRLQLSLRGPAGGGGYYYYGQRPEEDDGEGAARMVVANTLAFFVMTVLECDVALLCACAPTLRPVLARIWPRGMGEGVVTAVGRRRRRRRLLRRRRRRTAIGGGDSDEDEDEEDSVNLTVVSYHGYPWAQQDGTTGTAAGTSRVGKDAAAEMAMPAPPPPAAFPGVLLRTPTTLSLRSFMSSMAPRSRGQTTSVSSPGAREDREVLLGGGDEAERKRRSSVGFEGYYDQYMGYEEKRGSRASVGGRGAWGDSQESFVLGVNDPASPSRLSPVSALSGTTFAAIADGERRVGSRDGKGRL